MTTPSNPHAPMRPSHEPPRSDSRAITPDRAARILVVGDVMLDRYLWGTVERISPETPAPVLGQLRTTEHPGGAANVAANVASLGADATLVGATGDDEDGRLLARLLKSAAVEFRPLFASDRPTTSKTRVLADTQCVARIDRESRSPLTESDAAAFLNLATASLADPALAMLILSDYAKGALDERLCAALIDGARRRGLPVLVDPKGSDYRKYAGATGLTPNWREVSLACGVDPSDEAAVLAGVSRLRESLGVAFIAVTRGRNGITLIDDGGCRSIPTRPLATFDVCGAGDTVIAALGVALLSGRSLADACHFANRAAGIAVAHLGTHATTCAELEDAAGSRASWSQGKVLDRQGLLSRVALWRQNGETIVFTNGCFDILHAGHVDCLEAASKLGDRLVVALNDDASTRRLKGSSRPVHSEADRAHVIAALSFVDAVTLFHETTPIELIKALRPNVLVKGDDYSEETIVGASEMRSWGGVVSLIPRRVGRSTTETIRRLHAAGDSENTADSAKMTLK